MSNPLFTVTASDCRWDYYRGTGKGGQKRNKTSNCVRCTHLPSGAIGKSEEGRSQWQNRQSAFRRMAQTSEFKKWARLEAARATGELAEIERRVDRSLVEHNIKTEVHNEKGLWVDIDPKMLDATEDEEAEET